MILYGKIISVDGSRARVSVPGFDADVALDAILLQPSASTSGVRTWMPPSAGTVVAVDFDDERPEDSAIIGAVYTDGQTPPKTGDVAAVEAPAVYLGASMEGIQKAPRDDRVQAQLDAIKAELDALTAAFNAHVHAVPALPVSTTPAGQAAGPGTSAPVASPHAQGYTVGNTASDSVYVK